MKSMIEVSLIQQEKIIPSIYIKHIFKEISEEEVISVLEKTYNLGIVDKIFSRSKISEKDGHEFYSCDIHFKSWSNDPNALEMMSVFENGKHTRLNYSGEKYWRIKLFHSRYHIRKDNLQVAPVISEIYLISNARYCVNMYTSHESKIHDLIDKLVVKYVGTNFIDWRIEKIYENTEFVI